MPTSFMLELKNVLEVVRETSPEPTGIVLTQVANGLVLNHVHFYIYNLNGRWLCLGGDGIHGLVKLFRFPFLKFNIHLENNFSVSDWGRRCGRAE